MGNGEMKVLPEVFQAIDEQRGNVGQAPRFGTESLGIATHLGRDIGNLWCDEEDTGILHNLEGVPRLPRRLLKLRLFHHRN